MTNADDEYGPGGIFADGPNTEQDGERDCVWCDQHGTCDPANCPNRAPDVDVGGPEQITYHETTETILLGHVIGSAETEHGRIDVIGSGNTVRFQIEGIDGHVDLDLRHVAGVAVAWLTREGRNA